MHMHRGTEHVLESDHKEVASGMHNHTDRAAMACVGEAFLVRLSLPHPRTKGQTEPACSLVVVLAGGVVWGRECEAKCDAKPKRKKAKRRRANTRTPTYLGPCCLAAPLPVHLLSAVRAFIRSDQSAVRAFACCRALSLGCVGLRGRGCHEISRHLSCQDTRSNARRYLPACTLGISVCRHSLSCQCFIVSFFTV